MGATFRFIEEPSKHSEVLEWFRALPSPPVEVQTDRAVVLHFADCGPLAYRPDGEINSKASPVVALFAPRVVRGVLWSVGEVHFLTTSVGTLYPALKKVSSHLSRWLSGFECVYSNRRAENEYSYYLEGSVKERDPPVFALASGLSALRAGRYFVADGESQGRLDSICQQLRLRGLECAGV